MKEHLLPGWKILNRQIQNPLGDIDHILRWDYDISDDLQPSSRISDSIRERFAFNKSFLVNVGIEEQKKQMIHDEEIKEALIQYVVRNSWITEQTYEQVKQLYEDFLDEMVYCIVVLPMEEKMERVRKYYQIP